MGAENIGPMMQSNDTLEYRGTVSLADGDRLLPVYKDVLRSPPRLMRILGPGGYN